MGSCNGARASSRVIISKKIKTIDVFNACGIEIHLERVFSYSVLYSIKVKKNIEDAGDHLLAGEL